MERKILHIDMDAFFAAVEQLDYPQYRGKPVVVGGDPRGRGVVSTCSYEARKFGIHSAMPVKEAYRRCPQAIFLPVRGARYAEISRQLMALWQEYTPEIEPLSLDEAFLDLTGSEKLFGTAVEIARRIVSRIATEIGLNASIGLAPNKFLAKLGSDLEKPRGFVVITPDQVLNRLESLPVGRLWGVGIKTAEALNTMGVRTIGELWRIDAEQLVARFGEVGYQLYRLARGIDERPVVTGDEAKSIGREITFQVDTAEREYLAAVLLGLVEQVARRLRQQQVKGRVITLKIRDSNFKTLTKRTTLTEATDFEERIYQVAVDLAEQVRWGGRKVRLLGVSVSGFGTDNPVQLGLFDPPAASEEAEELSRLHRTLDRLKDRYGETVITKGAVLGIKDTMDGKQE